MGHATRRAVFLDRDGTLNRMVYYPDHGIIDSPFVPSQMELAGWVGPALRALRKKGFMLILVSNQPGVAKGNMTMGGFRRVGARFAALLKKAGVGLDAEYYCLHHPQAKRKRLRKNCACRKPKPGLILKASRDFGIDLGKSYMVGDGTVDILAGRKAGCRTVFVGTLKPETLLRLSGKKPDLVAKNMREAARKIR